MKRILLMLVAVYTSVLSYAQLAPGSHAYDFTVTDQFGVQHNLYTYLDQGYTVIFCIDATWNGPGWNYHTSGTLEELWSIHGPAGQPGVDPATTNDVMVIWMDGDGITTDASMIGQTITVNGQQVPSQGNWLLNATTGAPLDYPVCNPVAADADLINADYAIGYYPTIYQICPDRTVTEIGQITAADTYAGINCSMPSLPTDVAFTTQYNGSTTSCGSVDLGTLIIKNYGFNNLTFCNINIAGNALSAPINIPWTGNLASLEVTEVDLGMVDLAQTGSISITVTSDANPTNSTITQALTKVTTPSTTQVHIQISFDEYPEECAWGIFDDAGTLVSSVDYSVATPADLATVNEFVSLPTTGCYTFVLVDSYGDGLHSSQWGGTDGSIAITTLTGQGNVFSNVWTYDGTTNYSFIEVSINAIVQFGCTDPSAPNYNPSANEDDGSCILFGCTDSTALNYDASANTDDGSCVILGCTDFTAFNFNPSATVDDGSCIEVILGCTDSSAVNYNPSANTDNGSCVILGCTDSFAFNYNPSATVDDGSCIDVVLGCTDSLAVNYNPSANTDNGSCVILGCTDSTAFNFNPSANIDDGSCIDVVLGCTDPLAVNYNPSANTDNGSCVILGCMDSTAFNFNPFANFDDGSCIEVILGCTDSTALNYNPDANVDDSTCVYETIVADINTLNNIQIYPNPANDFLYVTTVTTLRSVKLYNAQGQVQTAMNLRDNMTTYKLNLNECSSGLYILEITLDNGSLQFSRVVKQ